MIKKFNFRFGFISLLAFAIMLHSFALKAANERLVIGKNGVDIIKPSAPGTTTLALQDQWFSYMSTHLFEWQNKFVIKSSKTKVVLRYADTKQHFDDKDWSLTVIYKITLTNIAGSVILPNLVMPAETLKINYTAGSTSYKDIDLKVYEGYLKAKVEITDVAYTVVGNTTAITLPASRNNDIFFDLEQETERYYSIYSSFFFVPSPPVVTATGITTANELPIAWDHVQGMESYDVEWILVDIGTGAFSIAPFGYSFNFRDATRINTTNQNYNIPLAFPRGILMYRVRGVATDPDSKERMEGSWSYGDEGSLDGNTENWPGLSTTSYRLDYEGLDPSYNWKYAATYAEEGKRKEVISYFDGSLRQQQTTTLVNSDKNAIVAETKYDFEGRAAVHLMPTPTGSEGIRFYTNFNSNFGKNSFDTDSKYGSPDPADITNTTGAYYGNNAGASGTDAYTPDAQGYPYIRTQYKKDGTDRIVSQSGVGIDHKTGSGHETKYYYGKAPQPELDAIFGNEAGNALHYQKNMVKDANGQVSISYHDQEGRTIATALSGTVPDNLLAIDYAPSAVPINANLLAGKNLLIGDAMVSTSSISPTEINVYTFDYTLNQNQFCNYNPIDLHQCIPICKDCKYDLEIKIINDEDGSVVPGISIENLTSSASGGCSGTNPMICKGLSNSNGGITASYQFSVKLDIGSYTVIKTLSLNQTSLTAYYNDLVTADTANHTCFPYPPFVAPACLDCNSLCAQTYTSIDPSTGAIIYHDYNGTIITDPAVGQALLANCLKLCNNPSSSTGAGASECEIKLAVLKADMSPGGQYFDNKNTGNNFNPPPCDPLNPISTDQNGWLNSNTSFDDFNSWRTNYCPLSAGDDFKSWNDVRLHWQDCFLDYLKTYHPEYCLYKFNCDRILCPKTSPATTTIAMSNDDDMNMMNDYASRKYYNPTTISPLIPPVVSPYNPADYVGTADAGYASITQSTDRYFTNECSDARDFEMLTCGGGANSFIKQREAINQMLQHYLNAGIIGSPLYMSIWYVLDDPDQIHLAPIPNGATSVNVTIGGVNKSLPIHIVQLFKSYHGDPATGNNGLFGGTTPAQTKYQFFGSVYQGFKKLIQYRYYKTIPQFCNNTTLPLAHDPKNWSYTTSGFQIRYPSTQLNDAYWANTCINSGIFETDLTALSALTAQQANPDLLAGYQGNCAAYASSWIAQLEADCPNIFNPADTTDIKSLLVLICANGADVIHSQGASSCIWGVPGPESQTFYSFNEVRDYYASLVNTTCNSVIVHPPVSITNAQVNCTWANYNNFVATHSLAPYSPPVLSSSNPTGIADAINAFYEITDVNKQVTAANIATWTTICSGSAPYNLQALLDAHMPAAFVCSQNPVPAYDFNTCSSANLTSFIVQHGFVFPYTQQNMADIATAINSSFNTTLNSTNVSDWLTAGSTNTYTSSTFDNLPNPIKCYDFNTCTSANLKAFIINSHFALTGQETNIAAAINTSYTTTTVTGNDVSNWLNAGTTGNPYTTGTFSNMPVAMRCTGDYPIPTQQPPPLSQCQQDNIAAAQLYYIVHQNARLDAARQAATDFLTAYKAECLGNSQETFNESYLLNQYYYTLYYYDQAGNLSKTVPPKGVALLTDLAKVEEYRANIPGSTFLVPEHKMVTHYWYNSLQQLIKQYTPDADSSWFYYDYLGRLVVSQNAKQKAYTAPAYSYTKYDELGRIAEVGEIASTPITYTILKDKNPDPAINQLALWMSSGTRSQKTSTHYDEAMSPSISGYFGTKGQENLRNRVASVTFTKDADASVYDHATHYSYDIHGNVKTLIQDNTSLETPATIASGIHAFGLKYIDYEYDLISGNVKKVSYQSRPDAQGYPQFDCFYHHYIYDLDNRLTEVLTSRDNTIWEKENKYFFYKHGPLARTEIGDKTVQGIDYVYTLQGWVKGINSNTLNNTTDAGHDALLGNNLNKWFGNDAAAYTLKYFSGDYLAKNNSVNTFEASTSTNTNLTAAAPSLYNGNISMMATTIMDINPSHTYNALPQITGYRYDQLNRIRNAESFIGITENIWTNTASGGRYAESFHYDLNGNIHSATRNNMAGTMFDNLIYNYWNKAETTAFNGSIITPGDASNKLGSVYDGSVNLISLAGIPIQIPAPTTTLVLTDDCLSTIDVDNQSGANYHYDQIGNLKSDSQEYIDEIKWNVYGKVSEIIKNKAYKFKENCFTHLVGELVLEDLEFKYDASGQRVEKIVKPHKSYANGLGLTDEKDWVSTYYIRDAQGNVMATYSHTYAPNGSNFDDVFTLNELDIYGSSRIGIQKGDATIDKKTRTFASSGFTDHKFNTRSYAVPTVPVNYSTLVPSFSRTIGYKELELVNHLGSVLTTVSDRRIGVGTGTITGTIDHYTASILSTSDYFSFGMQESERTFVSANAYRYSFGGQEVDNEVYNNPNNYTAEYWQYDARLGRRWNVDPIVKPWESSYASFSNNPIYYNDPNGLDAKGWLKKAFSKAKEFIKNSFKGKPKTDDTPTGKKIGEPEITNGAYMLPEVSTSESKGPSLLSRIGNAIESAWNSISNTWLGRVFSKWNYQVKYGSDQMSPPVKTDYVGTTPWGNGPTRNDNMRSTSKDVENDDTGINPGTILGRKQSLWSMFPTKVVKDIAGNVDKLNKATGVYENKPALDGGNSKDIEDSIIVTFTIVHSDDKMFEKTEKWKINKNSRFGRKLPKARRLRPSEL